MVLVPNAQLIAGISGIDLTLTVPTFKAAVDTVLLGGRDITLDLSPHRTPCPTSCKWHQAYDVHVDPVHGGPCQTCRGQGFIYEQRQTVYLGNVRWTNEPLDRPNVGGQDTPAGQVPANFCRTKTVIQSYGHLIGCLGAEIDGVKVRMFRPPRQTGWGGTKLYVVTWWEDANRNISNG